MNTKRFFTLLAVCTLPFALCPSLYAQGGSLTPPGAPAVTMKTLDEIEPRIPISSIPFTISQPGSYYLTASLSTSTDGVHVNADDVTLDLKGFTMTGTGTAADDIGISVSAKNNVTIKNGTIRGFGRGVELDDSNDSNLLSLRVIDTAGIAIFLSGAGSGRECVGNTISRCKVSGAAGAGIILLASVTGRCDANVVDRCVVVAGDDYGIYIVGVAGGQSNGNVVTRCVVSGCASVGINVLGTGSGGVANGNTVADCNVSDTDNIGIGLVANSGGQCQGNVVRSNTVTGTDLSGIDLGAATNGNHIVENTIRGVTHATTIAVGIDVSGDENRVEGNHITNVTGSPSSNGIRSSGTGNFFFKNTSVGQPVNFNLSATDTFGPVVTTTGALANTGDDAHPWANFSR